VGSGGSRYRQTSIAQRREIRFFELLQSFELNDKQKKIAEDLRRKAPVSIEQAQELLRKGKL
jgi:hypothetical protein